MQLWYHPVKLRLKISFAGIPILVQEIANEPSPRKLFILLPFFSITCFLKSDITNMRDAKIRLYKNVKYFKDYYFRLRNSNN